VKAQAETLRKGEGGDRCASLAPGWLHGISTQPPSWRAGDEVLVSAGELSRETVSERSRIGG